MLCMCCPQMIWRLTMPLESRAVRDSFLFVTAFVAGVVLIILDWFHAQLQSPCVLTFVHALEKGNEFSL